MFEKSLNNLKRKSLNDNTKKCSQVGRNVIFDMIHEKLQDVEEKQETQPAKQELLDDAIAKEENPPNDDKSDETRL